MIKVIVFSLLGLLVLGPSHGLASLTEEVQTLVKKVDARYLQTQDLEAEFSQETQIEGFDSRLSSSGRVVLKKPGLLRWDYRKPNEEQILVQGDQVMWYVPQHQQVVKGNLTQMAASKAPLTLLQGVGKLGEQFTISADSRKKRGDGGLPIVVLTPKAEDQATSTVTRIELTIHPKSHLIRQIMLYEKSGNVSTLQFSNFRINQGIDAEILQLNMPADVVVVDAAHHVISYTNFECLPCAGGGSLTMAERVLIVDDDRGVREALAEFLESLEYSVVTAEDGQDALKKYREGEIDIILADLIMPNMDGMELLKRIREVNDDLIFLMITGHPSISTAVGSISLGADDYVTKPFHLEEVKTRVTKAVEKRKLKSRLKTSQGLVWGPDALHSLMASPRHYPGYSAKRIMTRRFCIARQTRYWFM